MWISKVIVEGGVLDGYDQSFDPGLNVIIGARGTGKSSIIELIRYCLGVRSYSEAAEKSSIEHALGILGDGRVTVSLKHDEREFSVTRTANDSNPESTSNFPQPFVFSQAEIETVGLRSQSRLRLIDGFKSQNTALKPKVTSLVAKIQSATIEISNLVAESEGLEEKASEKGALIEQLRIYQEQVAGQSQVHESLNVDRANLNAMLPDLTSAGVRKEAYDRLGLEVSEWYRKLDEAFEATPNLENWPTEAGDDDAIRDLSLVIKRTASSTYSLLSSVDKIRSGIVERRLATLEMHTQLENKARSIRQLIEQKQKGASELDRKVSELSQKISLLKSFEELRGKRVSRAGEVTEARETLLNDLEKLRIDRTKVRQDVARRLSDRLGPLIRLQIRNFSQTNQYRDLLLSIFRGSGIRYNDLVDKIVETLSPQELVLACEKMDFDFLCENLDVSLDRAVRLAGIIRREESAELITVDVDDDVQIELLDGTEYKGIDFLSMGQKCTAILPIILEHLEKVIVLDQPEDHLDNAFVVGSLVKSIVGRSGSAQTIVATHNPNIPVLGNAQEVKVMDSNGRRCFVISNGSIDDPSIVNAITTLLEGGLEAFEKRASFYAGGNSRE
jgi:predicted ATPase